MIGGSKWKWKYLLPWNWTKCCKPCKREHVDEVYQSVRPEYQKISMEQAKDMLKSDTINTSDDEYVITEPISDILDDLKVKKNKVPTDLKKYRIYLVHDGKLEFKEEKTQLFGQYATVKDFLSGMNGQSSASDYDCYGGTSDPSSWILLAFTGLFSENRIYKMVHRQTGETYLVLTNLPYCKRDKFVRPSQRFDDMAKKLVERSDLSKPHNNVPVAANSMLPGW